MNINIRSCCGWIFFKHNVHVSIVRALQNTSGELRKDLNLAFFALLERIFKYFFLIKVTSTNKAYIYWNFITSGNTSWEQYLTGGAAGLSGLDELVWEFGNYWEHILQIIYIMILTSRIKQSCVSSWGIWAGRKVILHVTLFVCSSLELQRKEEKGRALNGHIVLISNLWISATVARSKGKCSRLSEKKRKKQSKNPAVVSQKDCLTAVTAT